MESQGLISTGLQAQRAGRLAEAEGLYRRAIETEPADARAWHLLGLTLCQSGRPDEGARALRRSVELSPVTPEFHNNLAGVLGSLGRHADAEAELREALKLRGNYPEALNNLGVALEHQDRFDEAVEALRKAVRFPPNSAQAHTHLSNALRKGWRPRDAADAAQIAVRLDGRSAEAHNALGAAMLELNRVEEAAASFRRAIELQPGHLEAAVNAAMCLLAQGELEAGFRAFECRLAHPVWHRKLPGTRWQLSTPFDPAGKTVLVYAEGGMGNTIQFARFVRVLAERGAQVVLEVQPPLVPLLRKVEGAQQVVARGEPLPRYDMYAAIMSLPALLHVSPQTAETPFPYLMPEPERVERCRRWLAEVTRGHGDAACDELSRGETRRNAIAPDLSPRPRVPVSPCPDSPASPRPPLMVGVCWQGDQRTVWRRNRSFSLQELRPLADQKCVRLVSLQSQCPIDGDFPILQLPDLDHDGAFLDTAALMKCLDLVVTCDTSVAHLAGALGAPVWVALPYAADWRWMLNRPDTPWYPTMCLFRQDRIGDWPGVISRMIQAIADGLY